MLVGRPDPLVCTKSSSSLLPEMNAVRRMIQSGSNPLKSRRLWVAVGSLWGFPPSGMRATFIVTAYLAHASWRLLLKAALAAMRRGLRFGLTTARARHVAQLAVEQRHFLAQEGIVVLAGASHRGAMGGRSWEARIHWVATVVRHASMGCRGSQATD